MTETWLSDETVTDIILRVLVQVVRRWCAFFSFLCTGTKRNGDYLLSKKVLALVSWGSSTKVREVTDFAARGLARFGSKQG